MMTFQFQNTLYRSHHDMLASAVYEWWTAGGANSPEQIDAMDCSHSGMTEAAEMVEGWGLDLGGEDLDGEETPSWMDATNTTYEMIAEAIRAFWVDRPDREAAR